MVLKSKGEITIEPIAFKFSGNTEQQQNIKLY